MTLKADFIVSRPATEEVDQTFKTPILLGITAHAADSRYLRDVHSSLEHTGSGLEWLETVTLPGRFCSRR